MKEKKKENKKTERKKKKKERKERKKKEKKNYFMKESPHWETVPRDLWMNVAFCPTEIPRNLGTEGSESTGELRQRHLMLQLFPKVTEIQLPVSWEQGSHLLCSELVGACAHMEALGSWGTLEMSHHTRLRAG